MKKQKFVNKNVRHTHHAKVHPISNLELFDMMRYLHKKVMLKLENVVIKRLKKLEDNMADLEAELDAALEQIATDLQSLADEMDKAFKRIEKKLEDAGSKVDLTDEIAKVQEVRAGLQAAIDVAKSKHPDEEPPVEPA